MTALPAISVLVRTWFGDDGAWDRLVGQIKTPSEDGFLANVVAVNDPAFDGMSADALKSKQQSGPIASFIADEATLTGPDQPILAVWVLPRRDDDDRPNPEPFRVMPSELWAVENNINLANLDWEDFTRSVGGDGIFRGF